MNKSHVIETDHGLAFSFNQAVISITVPHPESGDEITHTITLEEWNEIVFFIKKS